MFPTLIIQISDRVRNKAHELQVMNKDEFKKEKNDHTIIMIAIHKLMLQERIRRNYDQEIANDCRSQILPIDC